MSKLMPIVKGFYGNITMLSPDGQALACIDRRRANWYVSRQLAEPVSPTTIKLKFMPAGKPDDFEARHISRENQCAVCGAREGLSRHHIVPRVFRRFLPPAYKDRNHYDVIMLCLDCHERYEKHAAELRNALYKEAGLDPSFKMTPEGRRLSALGRFSRTLLVHGDKIPAARKRLLEQRILGLQTPDESSRSLESFAALKGTNETKADMSQQFAKKIVESQASLPDFIVRWRQHFLSAMNPKFMPADWDVRYMKPYRTRRKP